MVMADLYIRTQYDGKDLRQIVEIYTHDAEGEEVIHEDATNACLNLTTCADMGDDTYETLRQMAEANLRVRGIRFAQLIFDDD